MAKSGYKPSSERMAHSDTGMAHCHIWRWGLDPVQGFEMQNSGFQDAVLQKKYEDLIHGTCYKRNGSGTSWPEQETARNGENSQTEILRSHLTPHLTRKNIMLGTMPGLRQGKQSKQMDRWPHGMVKQINTGTELVRMAQDRSGYQRFINRVAHACNPGTTPWLNDE